MGTDMAMNIYEAKTIFKTPAHKHLSQNYPILRVGGKKQRYRLGNASYRELLGLNIIWTKLPSTPFKSPNW